MLSVFIGQMETNSSLEGANLMSISGIVIASMFVVQLIKRMTPVNSPLAKVPVFVYSVLSAIVLSFVANRVLKTEDGSPYLQGDTFKVVWAALIAAAGSSGFFTWVYNRENIEEVKKDPTNNDFGGKLTEAESKKIPPIILLIFMLPLLGLSTGCINYEKAVLREGMDGMMQTIKSDHQEWADALTIDPLTGKNHVERLPTLTPNQKKQIDALHAEYNTLVDEDRQRDKEKAFGGQK